MKILKLPSMLSDKECQDLIAWVDGLEIGEVKELKALKLKYDKAIERLRKIAHGGCELVGYCPACDAHTILKELGESQHGDSWE
jgi:hypothetical protein